MLTRQRQLALLLMLILGLALSPPASAAIPTYDTEVLNGPPESFSFGEPVAVIGDVDGDSASDFAVGDCHRGVVHLYSGQTRQLLRTIGPVPVVQCVGLSVAGIGDVTGDGVPDILVGDPFVTVDGNSRQGQTYLFSGSDGQLIRIIDDPNPGPMATGIPGFGAKVVTLGDVDGDGIPDFVVSTPGKLIESHRGEVYIFSGATGAVLQRLSGSISGATGYFGLGLATVGDIDGDGISDLAVGAPLFPPETVSLFSGATGQVLRVIQAPPAPPGAGSFGQVITGLGDITGDGVPDFAVAAPQLGRNETGGFTGIVFAYSGIDGQLLYQLTSPTPTSIADGFGQAMAMTRDVDGDRVSDLLVGAPNQDVGGVTFKGQAFVFSGRTGQLLIVLNDPNPKASGFGIAVAGLGDVNGDGVPDFTVGAPIGFGGRVILFLSVAVVLPTIDLVVSSSDLSVSNETPGLGETVLVKALIHNVGKTEATNVEAVLMAGDEEIARQTFASIPAGGQVLLSGLLNVKSEGVFSLKVTVDPRNLVVETNETNNIAVHTLVVGKEPENVILVTATLSKTLARPGEVLHLTGRATYNPAIVGSALPLSGGAATVYIPGQNWLETVRIPDDGNFTVELMAPFVKGEYSVVVAVTASPGTTVINLPLTVIVPLPGAPDLTSRGENVLFSAPDVMVGVPLTVTVFVFNVGSVDVTTPFEVRFFDVFEGVETQICGLAGQPACPTLSGLAAGASASVSLTHTFTTPGFRFVEALIDPQNVVAEVDELNNIGARGLIVFSDLPDLTPVNILLSDPTPLEGSPVTITTAIQNHGNTTSAPVTVTFLDNGTQVGSVTLSGLSGFGAMTTTSIVHSFTSMGSHTIRVEVDAANSVPELNEANNALELTIQVHPPAPDLTVTSLVVSPDPPVAGSLTVSAVVKNIGELDAGPSTVAIRLDGAAVGAIVIPGLAAGAQASVSQTIAGVTAGTHVLEVAADAAAVVAESNEANNAAVRTLTVFPSPLPDLEITANDFTFSNQNPQANEPVTVSVRVRNRGAAGSAPTDLRVQVDGQSFAASIPALAAGDDALITFTIVSQRVGLVLVEVEADPANFVAEFNEVNNRTSRFLTVGAPADLALTSADITFSNDSPPEGEVIVISARIRNLGAQDALGVFVSFFDGDPATGGSLIGRAGPVDVLMCLDPTVFCPEPTLRVTFETLGKAGAHEIFVVIDPENAIPESNEANNRASRTLIVSPRVLPPFISVNPSSLTFSAVQGGSNPPTQTLLITNTGPAGSTLKWSAVATVTTPPGGTWLSLSPTSGTLAAGQSAGLTVAVNIAGLPAGTYSGSITVSDPAASNSPQTVAVMLKVSTVSQAVQPIIDAVINLNLPGRVPGGKGIENSLVVKLKAAIDLANAGDIAGAIQKLKDFIAEVKAKTQPPASKPLTPAEAATLIQLAQDVIRQLGGTP